MRKVAAVVLTAALACSMASVVGCSQASGNIRPIDNPGSPQTEVVAPDMHTGDFGFDAMSGKSALVGANALGNAGAFGNADALKDAEMATGKVGTLNITDPGTYILTGELRGTVVVDPGAGDVTLVMDGVALNGAGGPAIEARSGDSLTIRVPENSVNTITNGMSAPLDAPAIESNVDVHFEGRGVLCAPDNPQEGFQIDQNGKKQEFGPMPGQPGQQPMQGEPSQATEVPGQSAQGQQPTQAQQPVLPGEQAQQPTSADQPNQQPTQGQQPFQPNQQTIASSTDAATEVVTGTTTNSAADLEADYDNATYITMTDENGQVIITSSGTYVVTGACSDGNITVKKGTTGVILVLEDLDLTSTTGATVSVNKEAEVQIVISGEVVLTDNENPDDEYSADEDVADAYDGAALKAKANSQVYVTGDGTLVINGNAKNGIKAGDDSSLVFDGVTVNITAANDGINANYDLTLLSGTFTIEAGDDAIHADHILTVGSEDGTGPTINVTPCTEGLEGTVVNIYGGDISIVSSDDAINAANGDGLYEGELDYSFNMMGGKVVINSAGDGIDSNGNVNLIGGSAVIRSASNGGEAGIDYDGELYVSDEFQLNNGSGVAGPDMMPSGMNGATGAMPGSMNGAMGNMAHDAMNGMMSGAMGGMETVSQMMGNQQPGQSGQNMYNDQRDFRR